MVIAARRCKQKLKGISFEQKALRILKESNIDIKNNVIIYTLEKNIYPGSLIEIEKEIKYEKELFFAIEGTKTLTLIVQKENKTLIEKKFKNNILIKKENLSLITITCEGIEETPGVVHYITGWFFDNDVNIEEFMSCYEDTLIVVNSKDVEKVTRFMSFQ